LPAGWDRRQRRQQYADKENGPEGFETTRPGQADNPEWHGRGASWICGERGPGHCLDFLGTEIQCRRRAIASAVLIVSSNFIL
ncbi:hypothetical protein, partial [Ralstonia solanacearum]|uniref:hypothetical protein n=1 Tax=Ralstonia solanacearum TaxID=305 RepID=UPI001CC2EB05